MQPQDAVERRQGHAVGAQHAVERMAAAARQRLTAAEEKPSLRPAQKLVAAAADQIAAGRQQLGKARMVGELRRLRTAPEQPAPLVHQHRDGEAPAELGQLPRRHRGDEAAEAEVAGKNLEQQRGLRSHRRFVVGQPGAVGGPHLNQAGAGGGEDLGDAEGTADLHQLAARYHHLSVPGEGRKAEQQRRGIVVHHHRRLGAGGGPQQALDPAVALASAAGRQIELQIAVGIEQRRQRRRHGARQRRAAEVGVQENAGGVEHPARRRAGRGLELGGDAPRQGRDVLRQGRHPAGDGRRRMRGRRGWRIQGRWGTRGRRGRWGFRRRRFRRHRDRWDLRGRRGHRRLRHLRRGRGGLQALPQGGEGPACLDLHLLASV
jgi:hypothetical protein